MMTNHRPNRRIELAKKDFGFAAAHMTVFSDSQKESLHGHNYRISLSIEIAENMKPIAFSELKNPLRKLCATWDEKLLLAEKCPHLKIQSRNPLRFSLCDKKYELPAEDVVLLPIDNVTCENLSQHLCDRYADQIAHLMNKEQILGFGLTVWESEGQGVTSWCRRV